MTANDEGTGSLKDHWGQVICLVLDFPMTASSVKCLLVTFFFYYSVDIVCHSKFPSSREQAEVTFQPVSLGVLLSI